MKRAMRIGMAMITLAAGFSIGTVAKTPTLVEAANPNKITICHRTAAVNNPYRRITVNKTAIADDITSETPPAGKRGHGQWSHNLWPSSLGATVASRPSPNVFNPAWKATVYQTATQKRWGDIIPLLLDNGASHGAAAMGLNYTAEGLAIYNGTTLNGVNYGGLCKRQSAGQFCESLIAEGGTLADCQSELEEMGALEDAEALKACGNTFSGCSLGTLSSVSVRTISVSCAANVPTLSGSVATGTIANNVSFEYGTDEFLTVSTSPVSPTVVAATPASITGTGSFTATLPALQDGTYYYRAVAIDPVNEGRLDGRIGSFVVSASGCQVLSSGDPAPTTSPTDTTTSSTTVPGGYTGRLKGVVWVDQNRNGKQDSNEPGLPFTPLVAEIQSAAVSGQRVGAASLRSVRKFTVNATTDALGAYDIPSLEPGSWTVLAKLLTPALDKTFDTGGIASDWFASAVVPVNGVGEADFAAAGNARAAVTVEPTDDCARASKVEVTWAGVDNKLATKDDVVFVSSVTQREALIRGLPWGSYTVTPVCADGTKLGEQRFIITKAQAASKSATPVAVLLTRSANPGLLPATGGARDGVVYAVVLLIGGGALLAGRRRRAVRTV